MLCLLQRKDQMPADLIHDYTQLDSCLLDKFHNNQNFNYLLIIQDNAILGMLQS